MNMAHELVNTFAPLPRTTRGMPIVLGGDPKGKNLLYVNGNSVFIRDISNPSHCDVYTEHSCQVNVAKYSPSGFYIASGDISGKVRIWDTTQKEHILKNEFQPFAGPIKDLAWSGDNQRICAVGEGREKFGHVFNAETGTTVGEIMGQSKALNSVDFRSQRPFRIVTASEDNSLAFFHGPPFKFNCTLKDHVRFANCVRYAPSGDVFVSGGADGRAFIYDGKTAEKKGELGDPAHKGGIYAVSFSPDSTEILTVSGDKTAKLWNLADATVITEFSMGKEVVDMQVGCLWQGDHLISISLSGFINYLDRKNPDKPSRVIKGHNKPLTAMVLSEDKATIFTGSSDGGVCHWDVQTGHNDMFQGKGHSNQIQDMAVAEDKVVTIGMDDTLVVSSQGTSQYGKSVKMPSQPRGLAAASGGLYVVACVNHIVVVRGDRVVFQDQVTYEPQCVDFHPSHGQVAIGGTVDNTVHVFDVSGDTLQEQQTLVQLGAIQNIKYSLDGTYMAAADSNRRIYLYNLPDFSVKVSSQWQMHSAKVKTLSWSPDSCHLVSGALDTNIIIWDPSKPMNSKQIKVAHPQSQVVHVEWLDNNTVISAGHDGCIRRWNINH